MKIFWLLASMAFTLGEAWAQADLTSLIAAARNDKEVVWYTTTSAGDNQAIVAGNLVFTSGQAGRNRETGLMGDIHDQAMRCIQNISNVLEAAGTSLEHVVKATIYLRNAADWKGFNEEYVKLMPKPLPARLPARSRFSADADRSTPAATAAAR